MSDFDVSLRLRLINQLSRPAEEAKRDLKELGDTAERLGQTRGGQQLAGDLEKLGKNATDAKTKIGAIGAESDDVRRKLGQLDDRGFAELTADADRARQNIGQIGTESDDVRRKLGQLDDRGFAELTADADRARQNIGQIGTESDDVRRKLGQLDDRGFAELTADADRARQNIGQIGTESDDVRTKLGQLDDRGFEALIGKASSAEAAIRQIGTAADYSGRRIDTLRATPINPAGLPNYGASYAPTAFGPGGSLAPHQSGPRVPTIGVPVPLSAPATTPAPVPLPLAAPVVPGRSGGMFEDSARAAYERTGMDAFMPIGMGAGYMIGGGIAASAVAGGLAYSNYGGFNREFGLLANTAGVDMETANQGQETLRDIANIAKLPFRDALAGFKALLEAGAGWGEALDMMPDVGRTTTASGGNAAQIAVTATTAQRSMGLTDEELPSAYDIMVAGGQAGQFELRDMAAYLPNLLSVGQVAGYSGLEGLSSIVASAQMIRSRTGSAENAAAQLNDLLIKMDAPETVGNFEDFGVDLRGRLGAARQQGQDPIEALLDLTTEALEAGAQLNMLFRDSESFKAVNSLAATREERAELKTDLMSSDGAVDTSFNRVADDAQAALDALSNSLVRLTYVTGEFLHKIGVTSGVNYAADRIDQISDSPVHAISPPLGWVYDRGSAIAGQVSGFFSGDGEDPGKITDPKQIDAYRAYGKSRADAHHLENLPENIPVPTRNPRAAARPAPAYDAPTPADATRAAEAINGRTEAALAEDLSGAAAASMDGYNAALAAEGEEAVGMAMAIRDRIRAALGFTVRPTIAPTYAPGGAGAAGSAIGGMGAEGGERAGGDKQSSAVPGASGGGKVSLTQNISSPNPRIAARKAQREQNRSIRTAQARANYDLGSVWS